MNSMRRSIIIAASAGAGFAIVLSLIIAGYTWYKSRPKDWNPNAITARFDDIDTGGEDNHLIFYFVLENTTNSDYKIPDKSKISIMAKRSEQEALIPLQDILSIDMISSIPTKQRIRIGIHFPGRSSEQFYSSRLRELDTGYKESRKGRIIARWEDLKPDEAATREEEQKYIRDPAAFVRQNLGKLEGFVLYDQASYYQINFPKGW